MEIQRLREENERLRQQLAAAEARAGPPVQQGGAEDRALLVVPQEAPARQADGNHQEAPEQNDYAANLEAVANFVDNHLGNGRAPRRRPDDGEWRIQRAKTIRKLNELREKLDTVCVLSNYGRAAGNSAEIAGAAISIGGACMSLAGLPSAATVNNIGNLVQHTGTLIDGVSSIFESLVSAQYLSEIEAELERDKELSRPLADWLGYSRELDANVQALFGVSLTSLSWNTTMKTFSEFVKLTRAGRSFNETMKLMEEGRYSVCIGNDVKIEKLHLLFKHLSSRPEIADSVRLTLSVLSLAPVGYQIYTEGAQVYQSIVRRMFGPSVSSPQGALNLEIPTAGAPSPQDHLNLEVPTAGAPSPQDYLNPTAVPTAREVSGFCAFQAVSMAISVVSLINAASIIRNGTSQYSDALQQLTRSLAWELRRMEEL